MRAECGPSGGGGHNGQSDAAGFVAQPRGKISSGSVLPFIGSIGHDDMRAHSIGNGVAIRIAQQKPGVESIFEQRRCGRRRLRGFGLRLVGREHRNAGSECNCADKRPDEIHEEPP